VQQAALQETIYGTGDRGPQRTVVALEQDLVAALELFPVVLQAALEGSVLGMTRAIDADGDFHAQL
jgi:hypothetical protein